ncbi:MAG TPA: hypothetical protein VGB68_08645 [Pyrinomonadaceae bacterium]|jgi:hypothetical protein
MKLENIKRVEEVESVEILNFYPEKGWNILSTEKRVSGYSGAIEEKIYFIIAWDKDEEPIYPEYRNEDELFKARNPLLLKNDENYI